MKPNKYATATVPKPQVVVAPKGMNRKDRRKLLFNACPCGSGKKFYRCCLPKEKKRREELAKQTVKKVDKKGEQNGKHEASITRGCKKDRGGYP